MVPQWSPTELQQVYWDESGLRFMEREFLYEVQGFHRSTAMHMNYATIVRVTAVGPRKPAIVHSNLTVESICLRVSISINLSPAQSQKVGSRAF